MRSAFRRACEKLFSRRSSRRICTREKVLIVTIGLPRAEDQPVDQPTPEIAGVEGALQELCAEDRAPLAKAQKSAHGREHIDVEEVRTMLIANWASIRSPSSFSLSGR